MPEPKHACPRRGCLHEVSMVMFCCALDWWALSAKTRREIWRTAKLPVIAPARRAAIQAAAADWAAQDPSR